jgi:hypothetical protein
MSIYISSNPNNLDNRLVCFLGYNNLSDTACSLLGTLITEISFLRFHAKSGCQQPLLPHISSRTLDFNKATVTVDVEF